MYFFLIYTGQLVFVLDYLHHRLCESAYVSTCCVSFSVIIVVNGLRVHDREN